MTAARVMPCRGGGARSITRPSEPSDRREIVGTRGRTRTSDVCPGFGRPALWPLSYARVVPTPRAWRLASGALAGEIGIEPMASCASDRRSTQAELLAY